MSRTTFPPPATFPDTALDTGGAHRVKIAHQIRRGGGHFWFVWECTCGASSRLYGSAGVANEAFKAHKLEAGE